MNFIDLFAGIGGIKMAFENAGFNSVLSNDLDKYCKATFDCNFTEDLLLGDIATITTDSLPNFDLLTAGFPCQPFSIAGKREGFIDKEQGDLFFEITRILKDKQPQAFLLENVKNLRTHDSGRTLERIYEELSSLGYYVSSSVLNTSEYGNLPQNRERIYIIGFLDQEASRGFTFPKQIPLSKTIKDCLETGKVAKRFYYDGKPLYKRLQREINKKNTVYQWRRMYVRENKSGLCPTLTANMGTGGHNVPIILDDYGIRKLTPRECANFQGFPHKFIFPGMSDSRIYKQIGNSVSIPVIERIAIQIKKALAQHSSYNPASAISNLFTA